MELTGVVTNGHVVLDQPCSIADGTQVTVRVADPVAEKQATAPSALGKRLLKHAGTVPGLPEDLPGTEIPTLYDSLAPFIGTAEGLPADMSVNLDHYLYGTPKRE